jgi:hypothetical protein
MITATQKFALAAASTTAVVVGSVLPAGAFQLTQYNFSGKTGSLPYNPCNPYEEEFFRNIKMRTFKAISRYERMLQIKTAQITLASFRSTNS